MSVGTSAGPHGAGPAGVPGSPRGASDAARPLGNQGRACRRQRRNGRDPGAFTCGAEEALRLALENGCTAAILKARSPSCGSGEIYDGSFTGTRVPGEGVFAVWHVRRDSKSGARRRSPKEDSPSCRKSTDGIKTKSTSTRGVAGCETVFSRGMHKKSLQRTAFVPQAGMEGNLCRKSLRAQIR